MQGKISSAPRARIESILEGMFSGHLHGSKFEESLGERCDGFSFSGLSYPLIGLGLYTQRILFDLQYGTQDLFHSIDIWGESGQFRNYDRIDMKDPPLLSSNLFYNLSQQLRAPDVFVFRVCVREKSPDIALGHSSQQGIDDGVYQAIPIGMAQQSAGKGNLYSAEKELPSFLKSMNIIANADLNIQSKPPLS